MVTIVWMFASACIVCGLLVAVMSTEQTFSDAAKEE